MKKLIAFAVVFFVASSLQAQQATHSARPTISYQGLIQGVNGAPVRDSIYPIAVSLWTDSAGGTRLWRDVFQTPVTGGVFNIQLGSGNPLPSPQDMDRQLWISVSFNGDEEDLARSPLSAVPMALNVADAAITTAKLADNAVTTAKIADSSITTAKLADHSVTWNKMGTEYVPYIRVNGAKVNTGNNPINFTGGDGLKVSFDTNSLSVVIRPDTTLTTISTGKGAQTQAILSDPCKTNLDGPYGNHNVVAGGCANRIATPTNSNVIDYAVIAGGQNNALTNETDDISNDLREYNNYSVIGGGLNDTIITEVQSTYHNGDGGSGTIGGGQNNQLVGPFWGTIGGGIDNTISTSIPSVDDDHADSLKWDVIAGGNSNIIGGTPNGANLFADFASIGGGKGNHIGGGSVSDGQVGQHGTTIFGAAQDPADGSTIAGGTNNTITTAYAAVGGGIANTVNSVGATIAGGDTNQIHPLADAGAIAGGEYNIIDTAADHSAIGGGLDNTVQSSYSAIGGGNTNTILPSSSQSFIGSGLNNRILASTSVIAGGGLNTVNPTADHAAIAGGESNTIDTSADHSFIGSGFTNWIKPFATAGMIGGGINNTIDENATYSVIGGGRANLVQGPWCGIASGDSNKITALGADHNFIGGGLGNVEANPSFGVIGGGLDNYLAGNAYSSTIGGGEYDTVYGSRGFLGGGHGNIIADASYDNFSVLCGGESNKTESTHTFLGGGYSNYAHGDYTTLGGGYVDTANLAYGFLGGGYRNHLDYGSDTSVLVGGADNYTSSGPYNFQGGGLADTITSERSVIVGGCFNKVLGTKWGAIEGGCTNIITDTFGFIGGGNHNTVSAPAGTIAGGQLNIAAGEFGTVAGGDSNHVFGYAGFIGGGLDNIIANLPGNSTIPLEGTIGGGLENAIGPLNAVYRFPLPSTYILPVAATVGGGLEDTASGHFSAVTGGLDNRAIGKYAAVLGGRGLLAQDYQTVVGRYNDTNTLGGGLNNTGDAFTAPVPRNFGGWNEAVAETLLNPDAPTFIVGNGGITEWPDSTGQNVITEHRSNAFTVSDNGHSTVYQSLGKPGAPNPTIMGSTYANNTIVSWGDIPPGGTDTAGTKIVPIDDIGVDSVIYHGPSSGWYTIYLDVLNPDHSRHNFTAGQAAITVSLVPTTTGGGGMITVTTLTGGTAPTFDVRTFLPNNVSGPEYGFQFQVVAR